MEKGKNARFAHRSKEDKKIKLDHKRFGKFEEEINAEVAVIDQYGRKVTEKADKLDDEYEFENKQESDATPDAEPSDEVSDVDSDAPLTDVDDEDDDVFEEEEAAPIIEESTCRVAVQNVSWDLVKSEDIFVALNSFVPAGGKLMRVCIYQSEFGKERMAVEAQYGPGAFLTSGESKGISFERAPEEPGVMSARDQGRLRKYEVDRMRYFYAVAEFDSADTALHVYTECDGREFELSGTSFDLRFIPDDMTFEDPTAETSSIPTNYTMKAGHRVTALMDTAVQSSWDTTDVDRAAMTHRAQHDMVDAIYNGDLDEIVASDAEDDEGRDAGRYKELLAGIRTDHPDWDGELEVAETQAQKEGLERVKMMEQLQEESSDDEEEESSEQEEESDEEMMEMEDEAEPVSVEDLAAWQAATDVLANKKASRMARKKATKKLAELRAKNPDIEATVANAGQMAAGIAERFGDLLQDPETAVNPDGKNYRRTAFNTELMKRAHLDEEE